MGCFELEGYGRGVLIFWDNRMLDLIGMKVGEFSISYQFKNCDDDSCSVFSEVYGPTTRRYKEAF